MTTPQPGPKAVSGEVISGELVVTRDDGSTDTPPIIMFTGTIVDNGDGTATLTPS